MIKRLSACIREYKKQTILTPVCMVGEVVCECTIPLLTADLINSIQNGCDLRTILLYGLKLFVIAMLSLGFGALSGWFAAEAAAGFAKNLRHDLYYQVQSFSFANIDRFSTSSLVTRLTTDVTNIQNAFMMCIRIAVRAPMMLVFAVIMSIRVGKQLAFIFAGTVPILGLALFFMIRSALPLFKAVFKKYDALNNSVQENVQGMRVVKSFVREDYETQKFSAASDSVLLCAVVIVAGSVAGFCAGVAASDSAAVPGRAVFVFSVVMASVVAIKCFDILLDASYQHVHGFAGRPCVVGREQQAVGFADAEQRTVGGEGFAREDVEGRAGDRTPVECFGQRRFIDDAAAGDVYEEGRAFHDRQFRRADQSAGAVVQRGVDRDDVGAAQQFGERKRGVRLFAYDARRRGVAHFAAECRCQPCYLAADGAESDDAPFRAVELVGGQCEMELLSGGGVGAALDVTVVIDDVATQCDGRSEGGFGHGVRRVACGVLYLDPQLGRGFEVDVVGAGGGYAGQPQPGQGLKRFVAQDHLVGDYHVGFAAAVGKLFRRRAGVTLVFAQGLEPAEVGASECVLVQKYDVRFHKDMRF